MPAGIQLGGSAAASTTDDHDDNDDHDGGDHEDIDNGDDDANEGYDDRGEVISDQYDHWKFSSFSAKEINIDFIKEGRGGKPFYKVISTKNVLFYEGCLP